MTIGALAKEAGLRPSAIRYYERRGLLPPPIRRSGRRDYDPDAVAQLAIVQFALSTGFTVREAKQLVAEWAAGERLCCPFFDIQIHFEPDGGPMWLTLTGREGTKQLIEADAAAWIKP